MKLSRTAAYAIHAVVYLARHTPGPPVTGPEPAKALGVPEGFLLRILVALARAGVLFGIKGPHGGYLLGRPAREITLLDVIEAVEGPLHGEVGFIGANGKLDKALQKVMEDAAEEACEQLGNVTIRDLMGPARKRR